MKNVFQAWKGISLYPIVPAWYPNRAIRRAVKQGRDSRIPSNWAVFLGANPLLVSAIKRPGGI